MRLVYKSRMLRHHTDCIRYDPTWSTVLHDGESLRRYTCVFVRGIAASILNRRARLCEPSGNSRGCDTLPCECDSDRAGTCCKCAGSNKQLDGAVTELPKPATQRGTRTSLQQEPRDDRSNDTGDASGKGQPAKRYTGEIQRSPRAFYRRVRPG